MEPGTSLSTEIIIVITQQTNLYLASTLPSYTLVHGYVGANLGKVAILSGDVVLSEGFAHAFQRYLTDPDRP